MFCSRRFFKGTGSVSKVIALHQIPPLVEPPLWLHVNGQPVVNCGNWRNFKFSRVHYFFDAVPSRTAILLTAGDHANGFDHHVCTPHAAEELTSAKGSHSRPTSLASEVTNLTSPAGPRGAPGLFLVLHKNLTQNHRNQFIAITHPLPLFLGRLQFQRLDATWRLVCGAVTGVFKCNA